MQVVKVEPRCVIKSTTGGVDLSDERGGRLLTLLHKVEMAGVWPALAVVPTLIRWWKLPRAPSVVEWKGTHEVIKGACFKFVGEAERAVWETMLEMETTDLDGGQHSAGATKLAVDLAKACEEVQVNVVGHIFAKCAQRIYYEQAAWACSARGDRSWIRSTQKASSAL